MSMIRGMSSEKPAEVRVRWIARIWSVYDVNGESMRLVSTNDQPEVFPVRFFEATYKMGARVPVKVERIAMSKTARAKKETGANVRPSASFRGYYHAIAQHVGVLRSNQTTLGRWRLIRCCADS